jgi:peroxiredoxin
MRIRPSPSLLLGFSLAAALALVVALTIRLGQSRAEHRKTRRLAAYLHPGSYVPPVIAVTLAGDSLVLGETPTAEERQVLLLFTTTCQYCKATLPTWRALADSLQRSDPRIRVIGVSLDSLRLARSYADSNHLTFPVVAMPSRKHRILYRAGAVPQTIVLDHDGQVRYATVGTLRVPAVLDSVYRAALDSLSPGPLPSVARRTP